MVRTAINLAAGSLPPLCVYVPLNSMFASKDAAPAQTPHLCNNQSRRAVMRSLQRTPGSDAAGSSSARGARKRTAGKPRPTKSARTRRSDGLRRQLGRRRRRHRCVNDLE